MLQRILLAEPGIHHSMRKDVIRSWTFSQTAPRTKGRIVPQAMQHDSIKPAGVLLKPWREIGIVTVGPGAVSKAGDRKRELAPCNLCFVFEGSHGHLMSVSNQDLRNAQEGFDGSARLLIRTGYHMQEFH